MAEFKRGTLHSGSKTGHNVTSRQQAEAILMSEQRNESEHGGTYTHAGRVTAINEHHGSSKHATIEVTHGKRKRAKQADGSTGELVGYDRPSSRVVVPKAHAKNFTMGQRVHVGVTPATEADDDNDAGYENDGDEDDAPLAKSAPKGKGGKAPAKKRGAIFAAMTRRGKSGSGA